MRSLSKSLRPLGGRLGVGLRFILRFILILLRALVVVLQSIIIV
jgi:hypothetical protein